MIEFTKDPNETVPFTEKGRVYSHIAGVMGFFRGVQNQVYWDWAMAHLVWQDD